MPSSSAEGSQTAVIDTEHTLATVSTAGVYELAVDAVNMVNGDELELRVKKKVRATGTTREYLIGGHGDLQTQPVLVSPPIVLLHEGVFTLKQTNSPLLDSGTATAGAATTLTDSGQSWTVDEYANKIVRITGGTGSGQVRTISSNTATVLTVSASWGTNPDATSIYEILEPGKSFNWEIGRLDA